MDDQENTPESRMKYIMDMMQTAALQHKTEEIKDKKSKLRRQQAVCSILGQLKYVILAMANEDEMDGGRMTELDLCSWMVHDRMKQ